MKLRIASEECAGFGLCEDVVPDVIVLDESGYATVVGDGSVPDGQEALARRAVVACPAHAILVGGDEEPSR